MRRKAVWFDRVKTQHICLGITIILVAVVAFLFGRLTAPWVRFSVASDKTNSRLRAEGAAIWPPLPTPDLEDGSVGGNASVTSTDRLEDTSQASAHSTTQPADALPVIREPGTAQSGAAPAESIVCSRQPPRTVPPAASLAEILAMPSKYQRNAPGFEVTVILSVFRRPQYLDRWIEAIRAQTHAASDIWVTVFNSPKEVEFKSIVDANNAKYAGKMAVKFIAGNVNFKYFGRMALGQMARTPYVQFFDDDSIPGSRVLENALHMINTDAFNGLIGMKGHGEVVDSRDTHSVPSYTGDYAHRPERVKRVDLCGGMWFLRTEWLHLMWAELPPEMKGTLWETGEDFLMSYMLQKYAGLHTVLLPTSSDPSTWSNSHDFFDISSAGDSTSYEMMLDRNIVYFDNIMHGYVPVRADTIWGEYHGLVNVAFILPSIAAAELLGPLFVSLFRGLPGHVRIFPIIITDPRGNEARARPEILKHLRMEWDKSKRIVGCWDAELFRLHASAWDDNTLLAESLLTLQGALAATRPAFVVVPGADASATFDAVLIAPRQLQIPVLQLDPATNCASKLAVLTAIDGSTVCVPKVEQVTTLLSGLVYRTNSVRMLLQRALNIMCACEQADSVRAGGAFVRCPTREAQDSLLEAFSKLHA